MQWSPDPLTGPPKQQAANRPVISGTWHPPLDTGADHTLQYAPTKDLEYY
jgi:hypothetical protein